MLLKLKQALEAEGIFSIVEVLCVSHCAESRISGFNINVGFDRHMSD